MAPKTPIAERLSKNCALRLGKPQAAKSGGIAATASAKCGSPARTVSTYRCCFELNAIDAMLKSGARRTSCTLEKVDSTAAVVRNRVPGSHRFRQAAVPGFWRDEEAVAGSRSGPGQRAARLADRRGCDVPNIGARGSGPQGNAARPFGEPPINRSQQFARLLHLALVARRGNLHREPRQSLHLVGAKQIKLRCSRRRWRSRRVSRACAVSISRSSLLRAGSLSQLVNENSGTASAVTTRGS